MILPWRLLQCANSKRLEAILLFLSLDCLQTKYQDKCVLAEILDKIKERYQTVPVSFGIRYFLTEGWENKKILQDGEKVRSNHSNVEGTF